MRLVICSDVHCDKSTLGYPRFDDVAAAVHQTVEVAKSERADVWAMLGDWCDPDDGPAALRGVELALRTALELNDAGVESWWLAGNHCVVEDGSGRTVLSPLWPLRENHLVRLFERSEYFVHGQLHVTVLPYVAVSARVSDELEPIRKMYAANPERGLVLAHATHLPGIVPWEESTEMPRGRAVPFPFDWTRPQWHLFNGHYHEGQVYEHPSADGGRRLTIPGALCRTTFGEVKDKARFLVVDV